MDTSQPLSAAQTAALIKLPGVQRAMAVAVFPQGISNSEVLAVNSSQAADVTLLRPDQSALPEARLFGTIAPTSPPPGVTLPGRAAGLQLTARLGPASLGLAPVTVNVSVADAAGDVYQLDAGTLPADGQEHTLTVTLANQAGAAGGSGALYPLKLTSLDLDYTLPAYRPGSPATFTLSSFSAGPGTAPQPGTVLGSWPAVGSSVELTSVKQTSGTAGPAAPPTVTAKAAAGGALTVTFDPGFGLAANGILGQPPSPVSGDLTLTGTPPVAPLPGIATQRFLAARNASVGSVVQADVNGAVISVKIVAAVTTFPTVSASGGALIVDLGRLQDVLTSSSLSAAQVTQWWLATSSGAGVSAGAGGSGGVPPGLAADLPAGSAIASTTGAAASLLSDPLSTVPQQALLAVAIAAAILAITGFCVSIAAGVHQRRAENALLAALGVPPRAAAGQLCLEKLMLSLPSAAGRAGARRGAGRTAGPRHHPDLVRDRAGAAGNHPVRLAADPAAWPWPSRCCRCWPPPDHRPAPDAAAELRAAEAA